MIRLEAKEEGKIFISQNDLDPWIFRSIIQQLNIRTLQVNSPETARDLVLLEKIEQDPNITQATLANQLGVAVGTINWHLKRLIAKGYVKVRKVERRKLRYLITPEGISLRARLTMDYIQTSFGLYRLVRQRMLEALSQARSGGYSQVHLIGEGDVAEVCRLTCLEKGFTLTSDTDVPLLIIRGLKIFIDFPPFQPEQSPENPAISEDVLVGRELTTGEEY